MAFTPVQKLSIGTGAALALLALVGLVAYLSITQMIRGERAVAVTNANIARLDRVIARTVDAENAQRGYVITGDSAYLLPLDVAQSDVEYALDALRSATEDNPDQRRNLDNLAPMVAKRFREIRGSVVARRRLGQEAATRALRSQQPVRARDGAAALAGRMRAEELRVLGDVTRTMTQRGRSASNFIFAASIFSLFLALVALQPLRPSVAHALSQRLSVSQAPAIPELRATLAEEARHAADRLLRLQQVIAALAGPVSAADVAETLLARGAMPLVASLGVVATFERGSFTVVRSAGETAPHLRPGSVVAADRVEPFGDAVRSREPVVIESRAERLSHYPSLRRFSENGTSDGAFVVTPLVSAETVNGVLLLAFADNRILSDDERSYLGTLGRVGGQAIARTATSDAAR